MAARLRRTPGSRAASRAKVSAWRAVHRVIGLVGAGEMAEREHRREAREQRRRRRRGRPGSGRGGSCRCRAAARRAGRQGRARNPSSCATLLRQGTRSKARHRAASPRHQAGEDEDRGAGAEDLAQRGALLGQRHEEGAGAGGVEGRRDPRGAEAVGVGLDHGGGLDLRRRQRIERAPVGGDRVEIDREAGAGDGDGPWRKASIERAASVAFGQALPVLSTRWGACMVGGESPAEREVRMSETDEPAEAAPAAETLNRATIDAVLAAVEADDHDALVALLEPLHEADVADLLEQISRPERQALVALWGERARRRGAVGARGGGARRGRRGAARRRAGGGGAGPRDRRRRLSRRGHGGAAAGADPAGARRRRPGRGRAVAAVRRVLGRPADAARGGGGARALDGRRRDRLPARARSGCRRASTT